MNRVVNMCGQDDEITFVFVASASLDGHHRRLSFPRNNSHPVLLFVFCGQTMLYETAVCFLLTADRIGRQFSSSGLRHVPPLSFPRRVPTQVSKAKTSATSLAARLADVTAELRASNGRLDDASSKVRAAVAGQVSLACYWKCRGHAHRVLEGFGDWCTRLRRVVG